MSTLFDPIATSETVVASVERYLRSAFNPRRTVIADDYARAVDASKVNGDLGGSLFREIRRRFAKGETLSSLHAKGIIHSELLEFMNTEPYLHQSKALELTTNKKRNVVIATGTGSGKTEAFLMPIINSLLVERDLASLSPGVRAIIVYPMNALAADQLTRIRDGLKKFPDITYGRFVGPTPPTIALALAQNNNLPFPANERPSREAILESPPHILITNYSMLERLLLLPKWQEVFTGQLKWIVMDEVHAYDGTKGIEISLLLRRLKARTADPLGVQCIASSATLGEGTAEDNVRAAHFAEALFGEVFAPEDIILPTYAEDSPEQDLIDVFAPKNSHELTVAKNSDEGTFHLFIKNPGGAFICLGKEHPTNIPRMRLQQRKWCPDCDVESRLIEIGACRTCGIEYLIAKLSKDELLPVDEFDEMARYFRLLNVDLVDWPEEQRNLKDEGVDENEGDTSESDPISDVHAKWWCNFCSTLNPDNQCARCNRNLHIEVNEELATDSNGKLRCHRCKSSGGRSPFGPIIRPVSGVDALTAVIATAIYQHLPTDSIQKLIPGGRRKLLAFSDNRQDAAYFAPYLEDSYFDLLRRRIMYQALLMLENSDIQNPPYTLKDLAATVEKFHFESGQEEGRSAWAWTWIRGELVSVDSQQSLAGTGLFKWFVPENKLQSSMAVLTRSGLNREKSWQLLNTLIESVAYDGAIELPDGVSSSDPIFAPKEVATKIYRDGKRPANSSVAWISNASVGNRRTSAIERGLGLSREGATQLLTHLWDSLIDDGIFLDEPLGQKSIQSAAWRFTSGQKELNSQKWCPTCRRFSWWALPNGLCVQKNCDGIVIDRSPIPQNHYRSLYQSLEMTQLKASEHTAQWTPAKAEQVQNEFIKGVVNVLSCSTTFEMGVDIGEVVAVLCRNVPPTPANYVQRAGRAGRRQGDRALIVTFARKRNHDAQFAADPARLIKGRVPVPIINLENFDLIRRHIYAIALSEYFRTFAQPGDTASSFFGIDDNGIVRADEFVNWLSARPAKVLSTIESLGLPNQTLIKLGIPNWEWINLLVLPDDAERGGWLTSVKEMFTSDEKQISEWYAELHRQAGLPGPGAGRAAGKLKQAATIRENLRDRQLVELLANGGILPKYGFPVDVASLTPSYKSAQSGRGYGLELSRDLSIAITEYSPGSQVVAGGKFLTSTGIKRPINVDFGSLRWAAATCDNCGWFFHTRAPFEDAISDKLPTNCGNCGLSLSTERLRTFIEPRFGFIGNIDTKSAGSKTRPRRIASSKTYLSTSSGEDSQWIQQSPLLSSSVSRDARLLTLSNTNYWLCNSCGYATPIPGRKARGGGQLKGNHDDPRREEKCTSATKLSRTTFGHEYVTDVLRLKFLLPTLKNCVCSDHSCLGPLESAAAALVSGAVQTLGVASFDLGSAINSNGTGLEHRLMIFDTTPGGAGLAQAINERIREIILAGLEIVSRCSDCTEDSSCYSCIRSYRNQSRHEHLTRHSAIAILGEFLNEL